MLPIGLAFDESKREELHEAGKFRENCLELKFQPECASGVCLELKGSDIRKRSL